eukprot:tig00000215_g18542.t1
MRRGWILAVALLALSAAAFAQDEDDEYDPSTANSQKENFSFITCRSVVKLVHKSSNARLHSHEIPYGSGSRQQSVTGFPDGGDSNSYWVVKGAHGGKSCKSGQPIKLGTKIRLEHLNTKKNLHSHDYQSPISRNYECSAFGDSGVGDQNDDWIVEAADRSSDQFWKRGASIRLRHVVTNYYLMTSSNNKYGNPIAGQQEIAAVPRATGDTVWSATEGIFIPHA